MVGSNAIIRARTTNCTHLMSWLFVRQHRCVASKVAPTIDGKQSGAGTTLLRGLLSCDFAEMPFFLLGAFRSSLVDLSSKIHGQLGHDAVNVSFLREKANCFVDEVGRQGIGKRAREIFLAPSVGHYDALCYVMLREVQNTELFC